MIKILLTSSSFIDTPGNHHDFLKKQGYEVDYLRGPLKESQLINIISKYDGVICGDDEYNSKVLQKGKSGKLKYISKYGVGLDMIDLEKAKEIGISVSNCKNVNQHSVAEHVLALLLTFYRNIIQISNNTKKGNWLRLTGNEIRGKTIGVIGIGAVGKEVLIKTKSLGLNTIAFDINPDREFINANNVKLCSSINDLIANCDIISLHLPLNNKTRGIINKDSVINFMKKGVVIVNTSRANIIDENALKYGLDNKIIKGFLTDVMDEEPMIPNHFLISYPNVIITSHIGSRTFESVEKQGIMAIENMKKMIIS